MAYKLSNTSLVLTDSRAKSKFGGSSRFIENNGIVTDKRDVEKKIELKRKKKVSINHKSKIEQAESQLKEVKKKTYKLNKSKVKNKCISLSRLEKSKKFLAFYSISFPQGLPDEIAYKIFNTWLTRCRKDSGLKSYLWVAERQRNLTVHFHLLTNDFMKVREVNGFMAKCLLTVKNNGLEILKDVEIEKVEGNKNRLISYLAKYITKNEIEFYHLPWHCSRDISSLFTTVNYEADQADFYFDKLPESSIHYYISDKEYYTSAGFKFRPNGKIYSDLDRINEAIYNIKLKG
jgi:hypothetical protein